LDLELPLLAFEVVLVVVIVSVLSIALEHDQDEAFEAVGLHWGRGVGVDRDHLPVRINDPEGGDAPLLLHEALLRFPLLRSRRRCRRKICLTSIARRIIRLCDLFKWSRRRDRVTRRRI
jgi:hypothetical protein